MLRHALLISTNNRIDRDKEIISANALARYVRSAHDDEGNYIGKNVMLMWHDGDPIGVVIACQLMHGFLVEVVRELPDAVVNVGGLFDEPIETTIKACWDYIQAHEDELGVSQGFRYLENDLQDGVYHRIFKTESSILPIEDASNPYTFVKVINSS